MIAEIVGTLNVLFWPALALLVGICIGAGLTIWLFETA